MSPLQIMVTEHLRHLGHYNGKSLRGMQDQMIDLLVLRIINDDLYETSLNFKDLYFDRGKHKQFETGYVKNKLKERTKCQLEKHGRMVAKGRDLGMEELTKNCLMLDGTEFLEKTKRLQRTLEIGMMTHLNLQNEMTEDEYYNYYLKNCTNVLY